MQDASETRDSTFTDYDRDSHGGVAAHRARLSSYIVGVPDASVFGFTVCAPLLRFRPKIHCCAHERFSA